MTGPEPPAGAPTPPPTAGPSPPPPAPLAPEARDPLVDALRGAALLGVLAVNVVAMGYPDALGFGAAVDAVPGGWALHLTWLAYMGKSYALLALLFGHGVGAQAARLAAEGTAPGGILTRRFLALGAIGLAHGLLGWYGDVLVSYAAFGFLLLPFLRARPRTLLLWAAGLLLAGAALFLVVGGLLQLVSLLAPGAPALAGAEASLRSHLQADTAAALRAYGEGPYGALFLRRLRDLAGGLGSALAVLPEVLALFLVGLWAARTGLATQAARRPHLAAALLVLAAVGLPLNLVHARLLGRGLEGGMGLSILALAAYTVAAPALAGAGAAAALLLRATAPVRLLTRLLAPLGRVSLSAYLLQTVVFTSVFYFHGLGLYGKVPFPALLALAHAAWLVEVLLAHLWLARFRLGPAEWLLRRLEYGRAPRG